MARLQDLRDGGHAPTFRRESAGYSVWQRPVYGTKVKCECGWENRAYAGCTRRLATQDHNDHLREVAREAKEKES